MMFLLQIIFRSLAMLEDYALKAINARVGVGRGLEGGSGLRKAL
jgi:hypothetical protein